MPSTPLQRRRPPMPQILVVTDNPDEKAPTVVYRERVLPSDLESDHFSGQLVERVGWALADADQIERPGQLPLAKGG
jgi:hypothetical protein